MIRINQVTLPVEHTGKELEQKLRRLLRLGKNEPFTYTINKRSIDARRKPDLFYHYTVDCVVPDEKQIVRKMDKSKCKVTEDVSYRFPQSGTRQSKHRPVIIGTGPAGLFCGLMLARHGYRPILLERGMDVDARRQDVERFWQTGVLNPDSNVQFGEGGAGTFSDGKLNTLVKDKDGRNRQVLWMFVEAGADPSILYDNKPHIGTDVLIRVVKHMREEIRSLGGDVRFSAQVTGILREGGCVSGVVINDEEKLPCDTVVLAIGHSARNTFQMLYDSKIPMEQKEFAAGFRVEHQQAVINRSQYGRENPSPLGAAPYKVTAQTQNGRGVYSFCMCPGGYVVNASSEEGRLAVNGMSYSGRSGDNANSAIIVSVRKSDFASDHPLAGIAFQRELERRAYDAGNGKIPVQRLGDLRDSFRSGKMSESDRETMLRPAMKGQYCFTDISRILPEEMTESFLEAMTQFGHIIKGFDADEVLVSAVESRTSSPVRIPRDETMQSTLRGLYPCGEGAGYAGGITSAAMDGIRVAEAIASVFAKPEVR
ncbi:MAG: NAD(P)/FAD-dependent oxidoreductase [Lachnospiraceae bacterium]